MENTVMRIIFVKTIAGVDYLVNAVTTPGDQGSRVKTIVGVGKKYWAWPTTPGGLLAGCDFDWGTFSWGDGAPVASADISVNNANLAELALSGPTPEQVLTWS